MLESSWAKQAYHDRGEEIFRYVEDERKPSDRQDSFPSSGAEIEGKLTFGKKRPLRQRIAQMFGAIEVKPMTKPDKYAEARQRKFTDWLQIAIVEQKSVEWIERLFIVKSDKDLKQLKDALLFLSENISVESEIGYGDTMKSFVETINRIENLIRQRQMTASESEVLRREIIKEIISLPEENGLRRKVAELSGIFS